MKQFLSILLLSLLVLLIGYGGAGVNMVSYCCEHCEELGTEALTSKDCCCLIHQHAVTHNQSHSESGWHAHEGHCDLQRVQFDWNTFLHNDFSFQPMVCCVPDFCLSWITTEQPLMNRFLIQPTQHSPPPTPRTYLSLLTVLLI